MDAPVDFSLDRARILNGNITPYNGNSFSDSGRSASVGGGGCVQDLSRVSTTPSPSPDFHRYIHPASIALAAQGRLETHWCFLVYVYNLFLNIKHNVLEIIIRKIQMCNVRNKVSFRKSYVKNEG